MKMWITSRLWTLGVRERDVTRMPNADYVRYKEDDAMFHDVAKVGTTAFMLLDAALENAEKQRSKRIAQLEKQIQKVRDMQFRGDK